MKGLSYLLSSLVLASALFSAAPAQAERCSAKWREKLRGERDFMKRFAIYKEALATCPKDALYNRKFAFTCERFRKYDLALKHYQIAAKLDPSMAEAHFGIADVQMIKGNVSAAVVAYTIGLAIQPDHARARTALEMAQIKLKAETGGEVSSKQLAKVLAQKAPKGQSATSAAGPSLRFRLTFGLNSARLTRFSTKKLKNLADALKQLSGARFMLAGHTDSQGGDAYNVKLSQSRAEAVRDYMVKQGLAAKIFDVKGYGSSKPIAANDTRENRAKNRRVEIRRLN